MALVFKHQFTCCIAGPTRAGKSVFVMRFLENLSEMIDCQVEEKIWCHGAAQPLHNEIKQKLKVPIRFYEGVPPVEEITQQNYVPRVVIIDDLMSETNDNLANIFTKASHHMNLSVINIIQNIFHQNKHHRTVSLNSHYIVMFKNPRDKMQVMSFGRQVEPHNTKFIYEAYIDATQAAHGYLLFDLRQDTPDELRYRTNIFPGEQNFVYVPRKQYVPVKQYDTREL